MRGLAVVSARHHVGHRPYFHHGPVPTLPITRHLMEVFPPFAIGLAGAFLTLVSLRALRLRWSWPLLALPVAYLAWLIDWKVGLGLFIWALVSAAAGAYWHYEDLRKGGEAAREVRQSLGIVDAARGWAALRRAQGRRVHTVKAKSAGRRVTEERLVIATNRRGSPCYVPFGSSRGVHGLILGATGSGKTVTQAAITQSYVLAGLPAIVLDPKGDRYLREVLREAAVQAGMPFHEWSPDGRAIYNPFERGEPTEIADKALQGHEWTEPHYELATRRLLGKVLVTMQAAGTWPPTLSGIVRYMEPERLDALASKVGGQVGADVAAYIDGLSAKAKADLSGGRDRMAILAEGKFGPRIDPDIGEGPLLSFERALTKGEVIYMHIDADRFPATSKLLAAALVIDLVTLVAQMQGSGGRGLLVIDEFAALAAEQVYRLFGRARSAGLSVLLGTQSLADLRGARADDPSDTFTEQVLTNIEYAVVHREADPDSAERLARMGGTQPSWTTTEKVGGRRDKWFERPEGTRTPDREFVVQPDEIKRLGTGEAMLLNPTAKPPAVIVNVLEPKRLGGMPGQW